jgi:hypothetical protein
MEPNYSLLRDNGLRPSSIFASLRRHNNVVLLHCYVTGHWRHVATESITHNNTKIISWQGLIKLWNENKRNTMVYINVRYRSDYCTWVRFSTITKLWTETKYDFDDTEHDYRFTYSVTGYPTFQSTRDTVPEWAVLWPTDWSSWSAEWPLRSPDFTPIDLNAWGYIKKCDTWT